MNALEKAKDAWGPDLPDWVEALAVACMNTSQGKVAARLGRSTTTVSCVLRRQYEADHAMIEEVVRGVLMRALVTCPALGELPTNECQEWRKRSSRFTGHNALRVRMYRACSRCPVNRKEEQNG